MKRNILSKILILILSAVLTGCTVTVPATPAAIETPAAAFSPTPEPTPSPTPEPTPSPTPEPTEAPTPTPVPLRFTPSEDFPLPNPDIPIAQGHPFTVDGLVESASPIRYVQAIVTDTRGYVKQDERVTFSPEEHVTEYRLLDLTYSIQITCLSELIRFHHLGIGTYTLEIYAETEQAERTLLAKADFRISGDTWIQLQPNNLRGNYTTALRFFGSPERFLFRYRFLEDGKRILAESGWRDRYYTFIDGAKGKQWGCHVDAVPYFEKAAYYLDNTYFRISFGSRSTGVVWLSDILSFDGSLMQRYTNSGDYISHHSFGTAVDINALVPCNLNMLKNRDLIYREVKDNLTYLGIVEVDGVSCYDFSYTGSASAGLMRVPEPLMNYLLYELAFYRAGFSWGLYYPHACDAMHFTLTELSPETFEEGPYALRKVFSYIGDEKTDAAEAK